MNLLTGASLLALAKSIYCFKPASRCLRFSKMNSRQQNRSKLSFTVRIITKYSLERFLSICSEKMSEGLLKFYMLRGTQREYSSKPLKHSIVKRVLVFKRWIWVYFYPL